MVKKDISDIKRYDEFDDRLRVVLDRIYKGFDHLEKWNHFIIETLDRIEAKLNLARLKDQVLKLQERIEELEVRVKGM